MQILDEFKTAGNNVKDWLQKEYGSLHTGRASPSILDGVSVLAYGQPSPIRNVASISIEDAKTLRIVPWDSSLIKEIERGIQVANLGPSVSPDGEGVRVIFPALTEENREKLVKVLKEKLEDARISVRKERESVLSDMKDAGLPEDDLFRAKEEMQKYVDDANKNLEAIFSKKEAEVMQ